jgi:hypothetical protein
MHLLSFIVSKELNVIQEAEVIGNCTAGSNYYDSESCARSDERKKN